MENYKLNQKGQLFNSSNLYRGHISSSGKIYNSIGSLTTYFQSGNAIRDGYYNVVGTISHIPSLPKMKMHP